MLNKLNKILLKLILPDDTFDSHHTQESGELYKTEGGGGKCKNENILKLSNILWKHWIWISW